jgi:hypothetical protein
MPTYRVLKRGFYGKPPVMYDPQGKRPFLTTDKPIKGKLPSWLQEMTKEEQQVAQEKSESDFVDEVAGQGPGAGLSEGKTTFIGMITGKIGESIKGQQEKNKSPDFSVAAGQNGDNGAGTVEL